jgi:clan AA aspartic protease
VIEGAVSSRLMPTVTVTLVGINGREEQIEAELDTGFNGDLSLPLDRINSLGWIFREEQTAKLGDGSDKKVKIYRGIVSWHGSPRLVLVAAFESSPLLGRGLLYGNELKIQFKSGGSVSISPLP